jgi:hypothetical protein
MYSGWQQLLIGNHCLLKHEKPSLRFSQNLAMEHCQTVSDGANQTVYGSKSDRFLRRMNNRIELDLIPVQSTKIIT